MMNHRTNKEHQDYLVTRGFLKRIKEALESGIYPDKERGSQLIETLEKKLREFEIEQCDTD